MLRAGVSKAGVSRFVNPEKGQGTFKAISPSLLWEYEHDETDEQIFAIENLIMRVRQETGASLSNRGLRNDNIHIKGRVFSWTSSTDDGIGVIRIGTTYMVESINPNSIVNVTRNRQISYLSGMEWRTDEWLIHPDGRVEEIPHG